MLDKSEGLGTDSSIIPDIEWIPPSGTFHYVNNM